MKHPKLSAAALALLLLPSVGIHAQALDFQIIDLGQGYDFCSNFLGGHAVLYTDAAPGDEKCVIIDVNGNKFLSGKQFDTAHLLSDGGVIGVPERNKGSNTVNELYDRHGNYLTTLKGWVYTYALHHTTVGASEAEKSRPAPGLNGELSRFDFVRVSGAESDFLYRTDGSRLTDMEVSDVYEMGGEWLFCEPPRYKGIDTYFYLNRNTGETRTEVPENCFGVGRPYGPTGQDQYAGHVAFYDDKGNPLNLLKGTEGHSQLNQFYEMEFQDGLAPYRIYQYFDSYHMWSRTGYVDETGKIVIPAQFVKGRAFTNGRAPVWLDPNGTEEGWRSDLRWGIIDKTGELVVPAEFAYIGSFSEGLAPARRDADALYDDPVNGYINDRGEWVIEPRFKYCGPFQNGVAWAGVSNGDSGMKAVLINKDGVELSKHYDEIGSFSEGLCAVFNKVGEPDYWGEQRYKMGFIDAQGREVIALEYDNKGTWFTEFMEAFTNGACVVRKGSHSYLLRNPYVTQGRMVNRNSVAVTVNGQPVSFDAYNIDGSNYFKLRDLAMALNGSDKQFNVIWNGEKGCVELQTGQSYMPVGGELAVGTKDSNLARLSQNMVYRDGTLIDAFGTFDHVRRMGLTAYTIDGNNYFRLRDVCKLFDIGVTWDGVNRQIGIDTSISYTD